MKIKKNKKIEPAKMWEPHPINNECTHHAEILKNESKITRILKRISFKTTISILVSLATLVTFSFFLYDRYHKPEKETTTMVSTLKDNIYKVRDQINDIEITSEIDTLDEVIAIKEYRERLLDFIMIVQDIYDGKSLSKSYDDIDIDFFCISQQNLHDNVNDFKMKLIISIKNIFAQYPHRDYFSIDQSLLNETGSSHTELSNYYDEFLKTISVYVERKQYEKAYSAYEKLPYTDKYVKTINSTLELCDNFNRIIRVRLLKLKNQYSDKENSYRDDIIEMDPMTSEEQRPVGDDEDNMF